MDNLLLEIKSYKFAQNREFKECMRPAVEVVLDLAGAETATVRVCTVRRGRGRPAPRYDLTPPSPPYPS